MERDPDTFSQRLPYLPILRAHLMQFGLADQVRFEDRPPSGLAHSPIFTCEVISKLLRLSIML